MKSPGKAATKTAAKKASARKSNKTFSEAELEAMQDAKKERQKGAANGETEFMSKVKELDGTDREMAEKLHAIITKNAPALAPRTWYGMPAWAGKDGKALCYFTPAGKFKERYATFGFNADARLDDGNMWPTSFALVGLGSAEERKIASLVKKAAS